MRTSRTGNGSKSVSRQLRPKWLASTTTLYAAGFAIVVSSLLMPMSQSYAQTWTGNDDANWHNGGNWTGGSVPGTTGNVVIGNPGGSDPDPILSDSDATVEEVDVNDRGVLTIDGSSTVGGVTLDATEGVTVNGNSSGTAGAIIINDQGKLTSTNGIVEIIGGTIDVNAGGTIDDDVVVRNTLGNQGSLTNGGTITGTTDIRGASVTNEAGGTMVGKVTIQDTGRDGTLDNHGTIQGNVEVIGGSDSDVEFRNNSGGNVAGILLNAGTSVNEAGGTIFGVGNSGFFRNDGTVTAKLLNVGGSSTNNGTIGLVGATGTSVEITGGRVDNFGRINGNVENGNAGIFENRSGGTVTGILLNTGSAVNHAADPGAGLGAGEIFGVGNSGVFRNDGIITAKLLNTGGSSTNNGTIGLVGTSATSVEITGGRVDNFGRINGKIDNGSAGIFENRSGGVVEGILLNKGSAVNHAADPGAGLGAGEISNVENSGSFRNDGIITAKLLNTANGSINNGTIGLAGATGTSVEITGGRVDNFGRINGNIQNGSAGIFENRSGGGVEGILNNEGIAVNHDGGGIVGVGNSGFFRNDGIVTAKLLNTAGSSINNGTIGQPGATGTSVEITGGRVDNLGRINGNIQNGSAGIFENRSGGEVEGILNNEGSAVNHGAGGGLGAGQIVGVGNSGFFRNDGIITAKLLNTAGSSINNGTIGQPGASGTSVEITGGRVDNFGRINGNVDNDSAGIFENRSGGRVNGILNNEGSAINHGASGGLAAGRIVGVGNSGLFQNDGIITAKLLNTAGNSVNNGTIGEIGATGTSVEITGGRVDNFGRINGNVDNVSAGWFENRSGGVVDGVLTNAMLAVNHGEDTAAGLAAGWIREVRNSGAFTNRGTIGTLTSSAGVVTNGSKVLGTTTVTGGHVFNTATGTMTGQVTVGGGNLSNAGTIVSGVIVGANGNFSNQGGGQVGGTLVNSGFAENVAGGTLQAVENSGTFINAGIVAQNLTNTNTASNTGEIQGHLINNAGKTTNSGTVVQTTQINGGIVENSGTLKGAVAVSETGRLLSNGILGAGLTNLGVASLSGSVTGSIFNGPSTSDTTGQFLLAGPLAVTGGSFDNRGQFVSTNGSITGLTDFDNRGNIFVEGSLGMQTGTLRNSGYIKVNGTLDVTAGTFTNSNKISMVDNEINDRINLTGNLAHTGTIEVDVNLSGQNSGGEQLADLITVSGETSGSGVIHFNDVGNGGQRLFVNPIVIIDGGASTANYTAAYLPQPGGLIEYDFIRYEKAPDNVDYVIRSSVNPAAGSIAGSLALVNAMLGTVVNRPSSAFVSGLAYEPEKNSCGVGPWGRGTGGYIKGSGDTSNGESSRTSEVEVRYGGYQTGADFQCFSFRDTGWDIAVGGFGGFNMGTVNQEIDLTQVGSKFNQFYGGAYIMAAKGAFAAELQGRFDYTDYTFDSSRLGLNDAEANSYRTALSATASYGFTRGDYSFVPTVGVSVSNTTTDDLPFSDAYDLEFERHLAVVGFAGATIARSFLNSEKTAAYRPFVTGTVYTDFGGEAESLFKDKVSGASQLLNSEGIGTFGEVSVGLDYVRILPENRMGVNQLNATIRGDAKFSDRLQSAGGTIQLRLQF